MEIFTVEALPAAYEKPAINVFEAEADLACFCMCACGGGGSGSGPK